jgi:YVTN family beta-propeller protein
MSRTTLLLLFSAALVFGQMYPSPVDVKLTHDGKRLYVVCQGTNELAVVDSASRTVIARIPVGSVPRGLTLSSDEKRAYVTNSWSDTVSEIDTTALRVTRTLPAGFEPSGVIAGSSGGLLYVANRIGNDISIVDLRTGQDTQRLAGGRGASYMAQSPDGRRVYVSHVYPNAGKFRTVPVSEITQIDALHQFVEKRLPLRNVAGVFHIALSADGKLGVATILRPKNLIPLAHVAHGFAFGNAVVLFGEDIGEPFQLPLDNLESHFSLPFGVVISPDKTRVYVSASGSDEIAILDLKRMLSQRGASVNDLSVTGSYLIARIPVGRNPRGLALSPDGSALYVPNRLDDNISIVDTVKQRVAGTIELGGPAELTQKRRGERLFYTSKFAFHGSFGCATCHIDSTFDGLSWDLEPDGFGVDIVDNRALEDVGETGPYKWNGSNPDLETECGPRTERFFFRSQGFSKTELADLVAYIKAIPLRPNRYRLPNGEFTPAQERGKAIFERTKRKDGSPIPSELQCATCHSGKYYTNQQLADVGSGKPTDRSPLVDVPQLTNVALTGPYLHDGSARTLEEIWTVFNPKDTHGVTNDLVKDELNDLIEFLKTL